MRYLSLLLLVVFFSCKKECPKPECADVDLTKGLLAYYPFNGNANDESGNGNNGNLMNGVGFGTDLIGRNNKAASFDGMDDYIIVNDNGKLSTPEVSVSARVLLNNTFRRHSVFGRNNFSNASAVVYGLGVSLDVTNKWEFGVGNAADDCAKPHVFDPSIYATAPENLQAGRWYQIVCTFSKGEQKIYMDGVLKATLKRSFSDLKNCSAASFIMGGWWQSDIISIDGKLDEVRVYNRVLSDCELKKLAETFINEAK